MPIESEANGKNVHCETPDRMTRLENIQATMADLLAAPCSSDLPKEVIDNKGATRLTNIENLIASLPIQSTSPCVLKPNKTYKEWLKEIKE